MELLLILGFRIDHLFDNLTSIKQPLQPKITNIYDLESGRKPFHRFEFQGDSASKVL